MRHLAPIPVVVLALVLAGLMGPLRAEETVPKRDESHFNLAKDGLAIEGYDPVAYFKEGGGKATPGDPAITHSIDKTTYRFASEANRDLFKADPEKYEPAYGGWCAYAMGAKGEKVTVNPKAFIVSDGHLFLFYKTFLTDTRKPWNEEAEKLESAADSHWIEVVGVEEKAEGTKE